LAEAQITKKQDIILLTKSVFFLNFGLLGRGWRLSSLNPPVLVSAPGYGCLI